MLLCDTGVLLAAGNVKDQAHQACLKLLRHADGPLLVPSPVLGEIGYLLQSRVCQRTTHRGCNLARIYQPDHRHPRDYRIVAQVHSSHGSEVAPQRLSVGLQIRSQGRYVRCPGQQSKRFRHD
jgi:predicted nucleic acid-binding protein